MSDPSPSQSARRASLETGTGGAGGTNWDEFDDDWFETNHAEGQSGVETTEDLNLTSVKAVGKRLVEMDVVRRREWDSILRTSSNPNSLDTVLRVLSNESRSPSKEPLLTEFQVSMIKSNRLDQLKLQHYILLDELGSGGMGRVYKARNTALHRIEAIKTIILNVKDRKNAHLVKRFNREAAVLARLSHPAIPVVHYMGRENDILFLAMEYVDGKTLLKLNEEGASFEISWILEQLMRVADALHYAHTRGIIHRDIKPANIMVTRNGELKLLDMGIAKLTDISAEAADAAMLTSEGDDLGTVAFMPIEQWKDASSVTAAADIYSLGITFYILLTGQHPFPRNSKVEYMSAHMTAQIPPASILRSDVPPELDDAFQKMMAKQAQHRYQSAAELVADLKRILSRLKSDPTLSPSEPASRFAGAEGEMAGGQDSPVVVKRGGVPLLAVFFAAFAGVVLTLAALKVLNPKGAISAAASFDSVLSDARDLLKKENFQSAVEKFETAFAMRPDETGIRQELIAAREKYAANAKSPATAVAQARAILTLQQKFDEPATLRLLSQSLFALAQEQEDKDNLSTIRQSVENYRSAWMLAPDDKQQEYSKALVQALAKLAVRVYTSEPREAYKMMVEIHRVDPEFNIQSLGIVDKILITLSKDEQDQAPHRLGLDGGSSGTGGNASIDYLQATADYLARKKYDLAAAMAKLALNANPSSEKNQQFYVEALLKQADEESKSGRFELALGLCEEAAKVITKDTGRIRIDQVKASVLAAWANRLNQSGNLEQAADKMYQAYKLDSSPTYQQQAITWLAEYANAEFRRGNINSAVNLFAQAQAVSKQPGQFASQGLSAVIQESKIYLVSDPAKARGELTRQLEKILSESKDDKDRSAIRDVLADAYIALAQAWVASEPINDAEVRRLIDLAKSAFGSPLDGNRVREATRVMVESAERLSALGYSQAAAKQLEYTIKFLDGSVEALIHYGIVMQKLDRVQEAESNFRDALRRDPNSAVALEKLAEALYQRKASQEILGLARRAKDIGNMNRPEDRLPLARFLYFLGRTYFELKQYADAEVAFNDSIKADPNWALSYSLRGFSRAQQGKQPEVVTADLQEAVRIDPENHECHFLFSVLLNALNRDTQKALEHIREANRLNPSPNEKYKDLLQKLESKARSGQR